MARGAAVVPGTRVTSFLTTGSRDLVGDDGRLTFATLRLPLSASEAGDRVQEVRQAIGTPAGFLPTRVGGEAAAQHDLRPIIQEDLARPRSSWCRSPCSSC